MVERNRKVTLLSVYTGDSRDKVSPGLLYQLSQFLNFMQITVTAIAPSASLSPVEQEEEWQNAIQELHGDGARPREVCSVHYCPLVSNRNVEDR